MGRLAFLEAFDAPLPTPVETQIQEEAPPPTYEEGFAAGRIQALAEAGAAEGRLNEELAEAFSQMAFSYAEARLDVMQSLQPLLSAMIAQVLPVAAEASLGPRLVEMLVEAAEHDVSQPLIVEVSAEDLAGVSAVAAQVPGLAADVQTATDLGPGQARIAAGRRETMLDLAGLLAEMQQALNALFDESNDQERRFSK